MGSYMAGKKYMSYERIPDLEYNMFMDTDGYKYSHWSFLPDKTTHMKLYFAGRPGGRFANLQFGGLQRIINKYIARKPEMWMLEELNAFIPAYGARLQPDAFQKIVDLGYWPVKIKAVKEGSVIPATGLPMMTIESTGDFAWVGPFMEDILMRVYASTMTASISYHIRKICDEYVNKTCENNDWTKYMLIGFGARATTVPEQAAALTCGHLFNFCQDDTVLGVRETNHYYKHKMAATTVAAMEHNTIIIWGKDHESDSYKNAIESCKPGDILSMVIDSYESMQGIRKIHALRQLAVDKGIYITFRPDSGLLAAEHQACRDLIGELYGFTLNGRGYKVFNDGVHLLYGDGIKEMVIAQILHEACDRDRWSAQNFLFGMGEEMLQNFTRGTNGFMMKLCWATVDGMSYAVCKETKGKKTLAGDVDLVHLSGKYEALLTQADFGSALELVYENGIIYRQHTLDEIRNRVHDGKF